MSDSIALKEEVGAYQLDDPAQVLDCARTMLGLGQIKAARELLKQALQKHPGDTSLQRMYDVIAPGQTKPLDIRYENLHSELEWIKHNKSKYLGKWVALLGDKAIDIEEDLTTLLDKLQKRQLNGAPLIQRLD